MSYGSMLRQEFTDHLDSRGYKYMIADENDNIVVLGFAASYSTLDTTVFVDFDESADVQGIGCVHFVVQDFAHCTDDKLGEVYVKLNELNRRFRWVKFWIDDDNAITADADAMLFQGSTGPECLDYVVHMSRIVEKGFNELKGLVVENMGSDDGNGDDPSADEILQMLEMLRRMMGDAE